VTGRLLEAAGSQTKQNGWETVASGSPLSIFYFVPRPENQPVPLVFPRRYTAILLDIDSPTVRHDPIRKSSP